MTKRFDLGFRLALFSLLGLSACATPAPTAPAPPTLTVAPTATAVPLPTATVAPTVVPTTAPSPTASPSPVANTAGAALAGTAWQWESYSGPTEQFDIGEAQRYTLAFDADGALNIKADCNQVKGTYAISEPGADGGRLSVEIGPATRVMCPPESRSDQFTKLLAGAARFTVSADELRIDLMADGGTLVFGKVDSAAVSQPIATASAGQPLTETTWLWVSFTSPVEKIDIADARNYEMMLGGDGVLNLKADCNRVRGGYTLVDVNAEGGGLSIEIGPSTRAMCPPESRGDQFAKLLGGAARYLFRDGKLFIDLKADGGTLVFASASDYVDPIVDTAVVLTAQPWLWMSYMNAPGTGEVGSSALYQVVFNSDKTVVVKADCNTALGSYTLDGGQVSITLGPVTLAACSDEGLGEKFVELLSKPNSFTVVASAQGTNLIATAGDGLLFFAPATKTAIDYCGEKATTIREAEATLDSTLVQRLDKILSGLMQGGNVAAPGVVILIDTPKGRYFKAIGVSDVRTCGPLLPNVSYQIGSNTKMMTAAMIFQLQEEGRLSTSDLLSRHLPDLAARIPNGDKLTLDMLLMHTGGVYDYINGATGDGPLAELARSRDVLTKAYTPEELVQLAIDYGRPMALPGAEFHYSNTGYVLLGLIIEKLTGQSYEDNLKTRIFDPLGLKNTYLQRGQPEPLAIPQGYIAPPFDYTVGEWNASQGWAAGAVVSTAEDFAVFLKALFTGKLFKQAATLELMQAFDKPGENALGPGTTYAHGMLNNRGVLGHGGQTPGFQSDGGYIPAKEITIVFWGNSSTNNVNRNLTPQLAALFADAP